VNFFFTNSLPSSLITLSSLLLSDPEIELTSTETEQIKLGSAKHSLRKSVPIDFKARYYVAP
jgi:hypothetical protein